MTDQFETSALMFCPGTRNNAFTVGFPVPPSWHLWRSKVIFCMLPFHHHLIAWHFKWLRFSDGIVGVDQWLMCVPQHGFWIFFGCMVEGMHGVHSFPCCCWWWMGKWWLEWVFSKLQNVSQETGGVKFSICGLHFVFEAQLAVWNQISRNLFVFRHDNSSAWALLRPAGDWLCWRCSWDSSHSRRSRCALVGSLKCSRVNIMEDSKKIHNNS